MVSTEDLQKLSTEFERIAYIPEKQLTCSGVDDFQTFLESVVGDETIEIEAIRRGYETKGWSEDRALVWSDVEYLVEFLVKESKQVDLEQVSAEFERVAYSLEAQMTSPGVEGFQIFFESVFNTSMSGVQEVRRGYEEKGWDEKKTLTWPEVKSMVELLLSRSTQMESMQDDDKISESDR